MLTSHKHCWNCCKNIDNQPGYKLNGFQLCKICFDRLSVPGVCTCCVICKSLLLEINAFYFFDKAYCQSCFHKQRKLKMTNNTRCGICNGVGNEEEMSIKRGIYYCRACYFKYGGNCSKCGTEIPASDDTCGDCFKKTNKTMPSPTQLTFNDIFKEPSKTKKLSVKDGVLVEDAFKHALVFLNSQFEYTRIEFKHGKNYIVVAKLKE